MDMMRVCIPAQRRSEGEGGTAAMALLEVQKYFCFGSIIFVKMGPLRKNGPNPVSFPVLEGFHLGPRTNLGPLRFDFSNYFYFYFFGKMGPLTLLSSGGWLPLLSSGGGRFDPP